MQLQGDQPAPDPDDERFRGPGSMAGAEGSTTEPVVTGLTGLAVATRYLNSHILDISFISHNCHISHLTTGKVQSCIQQVGGGLQGSKKLIIPTWR